MTEKDHKKSKVHKKRKRVGNRIPVGVKIPKADLRHRTPRSKPSYVEPVHSDSEDHEEVSATEQVEEKIETTSDLEVEKPSTFSGALESLLGRASQLEEEGKAGTQIMKDLPKKTADEEDEAALAAKKAREESRVAAIQRKLFKNKDHKVPDFSGAELESKLRKVATRGVVKLFNAIKTHQKLVAEPVGITRSVTDESSKKKFMESLKRKNASSAPVDSDDELTPSSKSAALRSKSSKASSSSAPSWEVLRDDYLLGAKMKDWNKESDEE
jgi:hypothetical protein